MSTVFVAETSKQEVKVDVTDKTLVSVVAPLYNEGTVIKDFLLRVVDATNKLEDKYDFEYILVDDGSKDDSLKIARSLTKYYSRLKVIELRKNYGQTAALQAGLDLAKGDIVISMDSDLQHFPEEIPLFLDKIEEGFDVVCGWRKDRQEGIIRRWPSKVANYLIRKVTGIRVNDSGTTFRAYRKEILDDIVLMGEHHRFVPVFAKIAGAKIDEVPIKNIERPEGVSNYGISRTLNVFLDLFFLFFATRYLDRPLRIFGKVSLVTLLTAFGITGFLMFERFVNDVSSVKEYSGLFTVGVMFYLVSALLMLFGIVAEVLSRIYFSTSGGTTYKIRTVS